MKEVSVTLTIEELNVVMAGLGKLPLEAVLAVFTKIKSQVEPQISEKQE